MDNIPIKVISYNTQSDKWTIYKENDPTTHKLKYRYAFIPDKEFILDFKNRLPRIINKIKTCNPDVICLQEIDLDTIKENFVDNFPEYDNFHHTIWNKETDKKMYKRTNTIGNITLWKRDVIKCITKNIDSVNSCAIFTELIHINTNFQFLVINVHLKAGLNSCAEERGHQIKSCLKKFTNTPTCICGDFNEELDVNSDNKIYVKDILDKHNFIITPPQITCDVYWHENQTHYYHKFDHVVVYDLDVVVEKCPDPTPIPNINEPSDHYPVIFNIKKNEI